MLDEKEAKRIWDEGIKSYHEDRKVFKVGGSVVVPIPAKMRKRMNLAPGDRVRMSVSEDGTFRMNKVEGNWNVRVVNRDRGTVGSHAGGSGPAGNARSDEVDKE